MITDLYKNRSYLGCLSASYNYFCNNILKILKKTAAWAALTSVVVAAYCFVGANAVEFFSVSSIWIPIASAIAILLLAFVSYARMKASLLTILNGGKVVMSFRKALVANGLSLLVYVLVLVVALLFLQHVTSSMFASKTTEAALYVGLLLLSLLIISLAVAPLLHSVTKYLYEAQAKVNVVWKAYRQGISHLGYLYCLFIILALLTIVSSVFLAIPALVTVMASNIDSYGVSIGDPSGLPAIFPWLNGLAIFLQTFVLSYVFIFIDVALCYAYGHVQTDVQLKAKMNSQKAAIADVAE